MSVKKVKNPNRYKKYSLIIGALSDRGEMNTDMIAETIGMSHSSVAKALHVLNEMGFLISTRSKGSVYYSLPDIPCAAIIDVSQKKYVLHICSPDGKAIISKHYRHDDRYFTDENLSFFLKNCALMLISGKYNDLPLHLIVDDGFISKYKNVNNSYNPITAVIANYFDLSKATVSNYQSCIEQSVKNHIACENALVFTVHSNRIMTAYVSDSKDFTLTPVRSIETSVISPSADAVKTAAVLAYAVGNTVSLFNIQRIIFDGCKEFSPHVFIPAFKSALGKFLESENADIKVDRVNFSLLMSGAVFTCHRRYLNLINDFEN